MNELLPGIDVAPTLHPMFVHFPIALWAIAVLLWSIAVFRDRSDCFTFGRWLVYFATAGAVAAVVSGWLAADALGHDSVGHDLVHDHRNLMLLASALSVGVAIAAYLRRKSDTMLMRWVLLGGLALTFGVATLGADRGAYMVYGKGVGVKAAPSSPSHDNETAPHGH